MGKRYRIVKTWDPVLELDCDPRVVFTSDPDAEDGYFECFKWILANTPFSVHEATSRQGYAIEEVT